jgi:uncharacterized membrane protein YphA (DoxX/SURF4 family)
MTFSQYAGIAIVPTLSRIVLAAVFITAGWLKFQDGPFTAEQAAKLDSLGVKASPAVTPVALLEDVSFKLASYQTQPDAEPAAPTQDQPPATSDDEVQESAADPSSPTSTPPSPPSNQADAPPPATLPATLPAERYTARGLHQITLMLHERNWPAPIALAWLATLTELLGGALLAVGLFSRLWGLGLAIAMGVALYLTSLPELQDIGFKLFQMKPKEFSTFGLQSALFVLAFGIFLTGAGPLSLDRFLFGGRTEVVEVDVEKK